MKKNKKLNNKGFSLVELIIVIAIMAVLVGVLAPQYMKYVEQSRRGKDIQAAANLQTAYLADIADSTISASVSTPTAVTSTNKPSTVATAPEVAGKLSTATTFYYTVDVANGEVKIYIGTDADKDAYDLTTEAGATAYKAAQ